MVDLLKGIHVLSFNHFLMGPVGVQFLADLGADVIAIEPPEGAFQRKWGGADKRVDGQSMLLLTGNRNKRSLTLDLKKPEAIEVTRKLIASSDVIVPPSPAGSIPSSRRPPCKCPSAILAHPPRWWPTPWPPPSSSRSTASRG